MTKADLVEQVADAIGGRVTKRDCGLVVDAFLDAAKEALARGDGIELRGFGTFKVRHRKARTGRNPRTGEPVEVPAPRRAGLPTLATPQERGRPRVTRARHGPAGARTFFWGGGGSEGAQPPASPRSGTREAWPQGVSWLSRLSAGRQARPRQPRTLRLNAPHRPLRRAARAPGIPRIGTSYGCSVGLRARRGQFVTTAR